MGIIFPEGVFPLLVGLFQIFTGTKAFKESHAGSDTTPHHTPTILALR